MPKPIKNLRWYIAVLLCLSTELNYLDRQTLSVLATTIQKDLGLTTVQYSYITSAFLMSYTVMYLIGGRLIDRLGTRIGLMIFVSAWSLSNMMHGLARTAFQLGMFRFLLGATEAANIPAGVKAVSEWFPMRERALAIGIFNAGTAIGATVAAPLVSFIALTLGWRAAFVITGALGFVWMIVWVLFYRLPADHKRLGDDERRLIAGDVADGPVVRPAAVPLGRLLRMRETWGCALARFLTDPVTYFLIFWVPKYLQEARGFGLADMAKFGWIPYVALTVGNLCSGAIPRILVGCGWTVNRARKTTMLVVSCAMPLLALVVVRASSPALALAAVAGLMFGHAAWGNITLPVEVFPGHVIATVTGFGGALGGLAGACSQIGIGYVVQKFSFGPIFAICSGMYLLAFCAVQWLIGDLGRVRAV